MGKVYISYCSSDRKAAAAIQRQLERRGFSVWMGGMDATRTEATVHPITMATACILLVSPGAHRSRLVRAELAHARAAGTPLIPFLIKPLSPKTPVNGKYINALSDPEAGFKQLLAQIEYYTQREINTEQKPKPAPLSPVRFRLWQLPIILALFLLTALIFSVAIPGATPSFDNSATDTPKSARLSPVRALADSTEINITADPETELVVPTTESDITDTPEPAPTDETLLPDFTAGFSAFPTNGSTPLTVEFTNTSSGDIVEYAWDFDDDGITDSALENPDWFVYEQPGIFYARLTVTNATGEAQSINHAIIVYAADGSSNAHAPNARFSATPLFGDAPLTVAFVNQSSGDITRYAWDFDGDGLSDSIEANPQPFTYWTAGMYSASLVVAGPNGISLPESITIIVNPPASSPSNPDTGETTTNPNGIIANFTANPATGNTPLTVTFTNQSSGDIQSYAWDFDGDTLIDSTATNPPTYTYTFPATYSATLTVTGKDGTTQTKKVTINAQSPGGGNSSVPVASFDAEPTWGEPPLKVTFTNLTIGDNITGYAWDFNGDGMTDSTAANPQPYTFTKPGTYEASLVVSGPDGVSEPAILEIVVIQTEDSGLIASFSADPTVGSAPLTVTFTNESFGDITGYAWDFNGDGVTDSTAANPGTFTYSAEGLYEASLVVSGPGGQSQPEIMMIAVNPPQGEGVVALFSAEPQTGTAPLTVTFTNQSSGDIQSYAWDFDGGGTIDSTERDPGSFVYHTPGTYTATLTVTGVNTAKTYTRTITITGDASNLAAHFSVNPTSGTAPLPVIFTSTSTGQIASYAWDFNGDGVTDSTSANPPAYTYSRAGTYIATLTITGASGQIQSASGVVTVDAPAPPLASFTITPTTGTAPLSVMFSNTSTGQIASYAWDFNGDGVTDSTAASPPAYTYLAAGTYTARLTVTGPGGTSAPAAAIIIVSAPPPPPTAAFTANPITGTAPLSVTFISTSTGQITGYAWDFNGDGRIDSTASSPPAYTYPSAGTYTARLTVSGPGGTSAPATVTITVNAPTPPPTATFTANPTTGTAPLMVAFTNTSSGQITGYAWDFNGDGVTDSAEANPPTYIYTQAGTYTVSLIVSGPGGTSAPATVTITVNAPTPPPTAAFTANPTTGTAPLSVTFTSTSTGQITGYAWDFNGDGVTDSTEANPPTYIYTQAGTYTATLIVSGPGGTSAPATVTITVNAPTPPPPTAIFAANPTSGTAPLVVAFTNTSGGQITGYAWDFNGDGVTDSAEANPPTYIYTQAGTYTATLIVSGPGGTSAPATVTITVNAPTPPPPTAIFAANPTSGTAPLVVAFTNTSSGQITGYAWDFNGDGVTGSTEANPPAYTYTNPGTYTVSLIVSGPGGTSAPATVIITVNAPTPPPTATFTANPTSGTAPLMVAFTNTSTGQITGYAWDFNGDGVTDSTEANPPAYTYTNPGTYTVTLIVSGPGGTSTPATVIITIGAPPEPPVAGFTANPTSGTAPLTVAFTNTSSGQITGYAWDFNGDGVTDSAEDNPPTYIYTQAGTYTATLIVSGPGGTSATAVIVITADPPQPETTAAP